MDAKGIVAVGVLGVHVAACVVVLAIMPRGFAITDVHAWTNTLLPALGAIVTAIAIVRVVVYRSSPLLTSALVAVYAGMWIGAAGAATILFPQSMTMARIAVPFVVALAMIALATWAKENPPFTIGGLAGGAALGVVIAFSQRAPAPSTHPAGGTLAEVRGGSPNEAAVGGQVVVPCGKRSIRVKPLLTFESRSPDRAWTVLAPPSAFGSRRTLVGYLPSPNGFRAYYKDDGESTLVATRDKSGGLDIEALSTLTEDVYAHLDTFTTLHWDFDATISFGPIEGPRFTPDAGPLQIAYLGEDLALHVVRSSAAEKGPYEELARGKLGRGAPLSIEVRPVDANEKGCRVILKDWSEQASTDASPTAGFGLPQNSIQFSAANGSAFVVVALAETGPGRGWASVGHAAGTYRNRVRVEPIR
jgi:hypothetical protein